MKKLNHLVIAEGEVTGHAHRASSGVLYEEDGALVLEGEADTRIVHEEHGAVELSGLFDIRKVQEFDHAAEAARDVLD